MDALDLLSTRRSIPTNFLGSPGPEKAQLDQILTIASRVPDHGKLTPWRFIVFKGDAGRLASEALAQLFAARDPDATEKQLEEERKRFAEAPVVIGVVSRAGPHVKIPEWEQFLSAGNAALNIVLAAHALGFAANWKTGWVATDEEAGRILGLKQGERFVAFVHIGTPTVPPADRPRPPLADVVSYWEPG